ncbi:MAG: hypothetical protein JWP34_4762 [Massilia sp.]|nr:hypothetical protein [Massilia sp.]
MPWLLPHQAQQLFPFVPFVSPSSPKANLLTRSAASSAPFPPASTWLGVLAYEGGTSMTGLDVKKFLGRSSSVMGSAGMTGKSSGAGMCVTPKVCQSTMSSSSTDSVPSPIHSGKPREGSPDVWGTCLPAGKIWSSESVRGGGVSGRLK